jgi:hypothetical protein
MGQLSDLVRSEERKFLSIHASILIIKHLFNESAKTTIIFLGQSKIFDTLNIYEKDHYYRFTPIDGSHILSELSDYALTGKTDTTGFFSSDVHKKYWEKSAFLKFKPIKEIGITNEIIEQFLNYRYYEAGHEGFTPFKDRAIPIVIGCGNPTIQQTDPNIESLNAEIARLKQEMVSKDQTIAELQQKNGSLVAENAINDIEISLKNSELLFIAVLLKKLQSAITTKRHKSQNAILQSIETEYGVGSGLSKSTTDKIMKKANGIYKSLITNKMQ